MRANYPHQLQSQAHMKDMKIMKDMKKTFSK
jgi:hypothetical protein